MKVFSILIFLATVQFVYAQKLEDFSLKHSMKQDGLSMQFTVLDSDKKGIRHHKTEKIYYWYKAQKVIGTQGGSSGQLLHGLFESFYSNKQLCEKGVYVKGLKDGKWYSWRTDGTLLSEEQWNNGRQKGTQLSYNAKGEISKTTIIHGKKSRSQSGDSLVAISRTSKVITVFDTLGRKLSVARYKNSLLNGKQERFSADGTKAVTTYKNGELSVKKEHTKKDKEAVKTNETNAAENEGFFKRLKKCFTKKSKKEDSEPTEAEPTKERRKEKKSASEDGKKKFRLFNRKST